MEMVFEPVVMIGVTVILMEALVLVQPPEVTILLNQVVEVSGVDTNVIAFAPGTFVKVRLSGEDCH